MKEIFRIATASKLNSNYQVIGDKSKVSKDMFWQMVNTKIKEITKEYPKKFDETFDKVKTHLEGGNSISITDTWFEIKNN